MERVFTSENNSDISAVYRLGSPYVNWYLVDSAKGLLVIDTGLAGHWPQLLQVVKQIGKTVTDITLLSLVISYP